MDFNLSFLSLGAAVEVAASSPAELAVAFLTLCVLEVVLGIDNIIFISILAGKLPAHHNSQRPASSV
jgi:predicted tellurium resistance membrane protein TerC